VKPTPQLDRSRAALVLIAAFLLAFGVVPMANLLTSGHALPWWSGAVREWLLYGGLTALAALALAHWQGARLDAVLERARGVVMRPAPRAFGALVAALAFALAVAAAQYAFARQPHSLDEMEALWQARIYAAGRFSAVPIAHREFTSMMNVIDWGKWYTLFPAGGPAVLTAGLVLGVAWLVDPVCAAIGVAASYRFTRRAFGEDIARPAALLLAISPFFLFMAAGFQNHTPALAALMLALAMLPDWREASSVRAAVRAGACIGLALGALTAIRPLDGAIASLVLGAFQVSHAVRARTRAPWLGIAAQAAAGAVPVAFLLLANARTTGHPLTFAYDVMWGARGLGFGASPFGEAHTPVRALVLLSENLMRLDVYLLEWPVPAVLLAALALALLRAPTAWDVLAAALIVAFVCGYALYWHDGFWVGPRFMYPVIPLYVLFIARLPREAAARTGEPLVARAAQAFLPLCVIASIVSPGSTSGIRLRAAQYHDSLRELRTDIAQEARDAGLKNALVFVHEGWGARLMARMWALGISRADAERLLAQSDACALEMQLLWEESPPLADSATRAARLWAATPADARATLHARPEVSADETLRFADGAPFTAQCHENAIADSAGVALYPPFLAQDHVGRDGRLTGDVIYVRDLGAHDAALLREFGGREWYRWVASGGRRFIRMR